MTDPAGPSRRNLIRAGAWSLPALAAAVAAPAAAATNGPDLTHAVSATGAMIITPTPGTPDNFVLDFNAAGPTTFDASAIFSTPAGDAHCEDLIPCGPFAWMLTWSATSSGLIPSDPVFTSGANETAVTFLNNEWGFDAVCSVTVTATSIAAYAPVSYTIHFTVTAD